MVFKIILLEVVIYFQVINCFLVEIENIKVLNYRNVVKLKDYSYSEQRFFLILEYCNGDSIEDLLDCCGD